MAYANEETLSQAFSFWDGLDEEAKRTLCQQSAPITYPKGAHIHDGQECTGVILVKSGCLRVYLLSETGKEVTLYRLNPGIFACCRLPACCKALRSTCSSMPKKTASA